MAATLVKSVKLQIRADDGDTEAKLDSISRKADELAAKHPDLKVKVDSAAASAKLAVLKQELRDTGSQSDKSGGKLAALGGVLNTLTLGVSHGVGQMSLFQKVVAGLGVATGLGEPLVAGLTVAVGGLSSGLVAAGAGLGAFGLVAKSNLTAASTAASAVQSAQDTYNASIAAGVKHATAYQAEQKAIGIAYAELSPAQITMSKQIGGVQNAWQSFVQSNTAGVDQVMTRGIGLLPHVFAAMQPLMAPTEKALGGLVTQLGKGLDSRGFSSFMSMLAANTGPAITKLGDAIGHIVVGLGGILRAFMPVSHEMMGGLDNITAKFAHWGQTLSGHSGFQSMMTMFRQETPIVMNDLKQLAGIVKTVVGSMAGLTTVSNSTSLFKLAGPILTFANALLKAHPGLVQLVLYAKLASDSLGKLGKVFGGLSTGVTAVKGAAGAMSNLSKGFSDSEAAAADATGVWGTFGGKLSAGVTAIKEWGIWSKIAGAATKVWTGIQAAFDVVMDANPVVLIIAGIVALVAVIVILVVKVKAFRDFWKDVWKDVQGVAAAAWHFIDGSLIHPLVAAIGDTVEFIRSHWKLLAEILTGPIGFAVGFIVTHWHEIVSETSRLVSDVTGFFSRMVGDVVGFFERLPGQIMSAIASLGSMLWNAGAHAIDSLIGGLASGIGKIGNVMGGVASKIAGFIGLSPAREGPLSGGGAPEIRGQHIGQDIARGITSQVATVGAAANRLAAAAAPRTGGAGGPGAAGGGPLQIELVGGAGGLEGAVWDWLREHVRIKGGGGPFSAQRALGEVSPG